MISISSRGTSIPPSPIRKLVPYAEAAKKRGTHVYHLNIGQPDLPTPSLMRHAIRSMNHDVIEYGHSGGEWAYREGLVGYYSKWGIRVTKEQILVTTAGSEAILFAMLATMDPGDEILIPEPLYTNYLGFAVMAGVVVVPVTCSRDSGFALPSKEAFEAKVTERTKAILVCSPNNPTGYVLTKQEMEMLKELVKKHDLFLLSDEVYREFVFNGKQHVSAMHLSGIEQQTILIDSVSKRYSACGVRVGSLVTKNTEILEAVLRFGQARLSPPVLGQVAALASLQTPQHYFDESMAEYKNRRDVLFEGLEQIPGIVGKKPNGAFYAIVRLPVDDAEKFCIWLLEEFSEDGETVMLAPANGFYATPGMGTREVRIAYVLNVKAIRRCTDLLKKALEQYPGRILHTKSSRKSAGSGNAFVFQMMRDKS